MKYYPAVPGSTNKIQVGLEMVEYANTDEFYGKAICYQAYFNILRKNRNRQLKTPLELLSQHYHGISPWITTLPPLDVSPLIRYHTPAYHVCKAVIILINVS